MLHDLEAEVVQAEKVATDRLRKRSVVSPVAQKVLVALAIVLALTVVTCLVLGLT